MHNYRFLPTTLLTMTALAGCSSAPENTYLTEASSDYSAASNKPQVTRLAQSELQKAREALSRANKASMNNEDTAKINHLAYLAKQRVAIAEQAAMQKQAEIVIDNANRERNEVRLQARTNEATAAQREAEAARQKSLMLLHQTEALEQQARKAENRAGKLETELKELNAKQTERGLVITLSDVLFATNETQLKQGSIRSLQKVAEFLRKHPERRAQIEGHTDSTGNPDYNQKLSERRAEAVRKSLMNMGIENNRIMTRGYGQSSPIAPNDTATGRQLNRRVEIILSDNTDTMS